jgi:hypothetical protein
MKTIALCLCLALATAPIARADEPMVSRPLSPHAGVYRRARAEIIAGAVIMALSAVGAILATSMFAVARSCPKDSDCFSVFVAVMSTTGAVIESQVGVPLFIDGLVRKRNARARFLPVVGPSTIGAGMRLEF